jgi:predicted transcriptional regulator
VKEKIIQQIKDKFKKTHGGITAIQLMELNNLTYFQIKPILTELHKDKIIKTRKGINHTLIYLNNDK